MSDVFPFFVGKQYDLFDYRTNRRLAANEDDFIQQIAGNWSNWIALADGKYNPLEWNPDFGDFLDYEWGAKTKKVFAPNAARTLFYRGMINNKWTREFTRDNILLWYRRAKNLGPLPEDYDVEGPGIGQFGEFFKKNQPEWPNPGTPQKTRLVFWLEDFDKCIGRMPRALAQVSKWSEPNKRYYIWNSYGTDRTWVRDEKLGTWSTGTDVGEWFAQAASLIGSVFQIIASAIATVLSFGLAGPAVVAVNIISFGIQFLQAISNGDIASALASMLSILGITGVGQIAQSVISQVRSHIALIINSPLKLITDLYFKAKAIIDQVKATGLHLLSIVNGTMALGLPRVTDDYKQIVKSYLDNSVWFDRGFIFPEREVPAFAQGQADFGRILNAAREEQNKRLVDASGMTFAAPAVSVNNLRRSSNIVSAALSGSNPAIEIIKETPKNTDAGRSLQASLDIIKGQEYVRMLARKYGIAL